MRKEIDAYYRKLLDSVEGISCIQRTATDVDNYSYFPIVVSDSFRLSRDELFEEFKKQHIFARKYFYPIMTDLTVYHSYRTETPQAKFLSEHVLCLPMYPMLGKKDMQKIVSVIKQEVV